VGNFEFDLINRLNTLGLGYHLLTDFNKNYFIASFRVLEIVPIDVEIIQKVVEVRSRYRLTLGDSIISATGLIHDFELLTRNTKYF
jgi:predicted nucleic acid-binding protein